MVILWYFEIEHGSEMHVFTWYFQEYHDTAMVHVEETMEIM